MGFILIFLIEACAHKVSYHSPIFFDSSIKDDLANPEACLNEALHPMTLESYQEAKETGTGMSISHATATVSNGWQVIGFYQANQNFNIAPKTGWDMRFETEYLPCYHVALLQKAQPATRSYFSNQNTKKLLKEVSRSLSSKESKKEFSNEQLTLTSDNLYQTYYLVAAADFNGDGIEDILCDYVEQARQGTAFAVTPALSHSH